MRIVKQARQQVDGKLQKPDIAPFIPKGMEDPVARVVAAGMKLMYAPEMRPRLMAHVQSDKASIQTLAQGVTDLIKQLEARSNGGQGGIPQAALFPAAMQLLGEAADVAQASGQPITQDEYNQAAQLMFALIGKQVVHGTDKQLMLGAANVVAGGAPAGGSVDTGGTGMGGGQDPNAAPAGAAPPDEEEAAMQAGFQRGGR